MGGRACASRFFGKGHGDNSSWSSRGSSCDYGSKGRGHFGNLASDVEACCCLITDLCRPLLWDHNSSIWGAVPEACKVLRSRHGIHAGTFFGGKVDSRSICGEVLPRHGCSAFGHLFAHDLSIYPRCLQLLAFGVRCKRGHCRNGACQPPSTMALRIFAFGPRDFRRHAFYHHVPHAPCERICRRTAVPILSPGHRTDTRWSNSFGGEVAYPTHCSGVGRGLLPICVHRPRRQAVHNSCVLGK